MSVPRTSTRSTAVHGNAYETDTSHSILFVSAAKRKVGLVPAQEVHHKIPISQGGTHARDNLMSLCRSCHTKIHHEIGDR